MEKFNAECRIIELELMAMQSISPDGFVKMGDLKNKLYQDFSSILFDCIQPTDYISLCYNIEYLDNINNNIKKIEHNCHIDRYIRLFDSQKLITALNYFFATYGNNNAVNITLVAKTIINECPYFKLFNLEYLIERIKEIENDNFQITNDNIKSTSNI